VAPRKKAPKRSKTASRPKSASKSKGAKSATAKSKRKASPKKKTKTPKKKNKTTSSKRKAAVKKSASSTKAGKKSKKKATGSAKATQSAKKAIKSKSSANAVKRKGRVGKNPSRNSSTAPPPEEKPLPKTRLNDKQLAEFKQKLLEKRRMLTGDVRNLTLDAFRRDGTGELSNMPIHMADIGSDNWEQEFTLGLIENEQQLVREIDNALARIEDRSYGVCVATGKHIGIARLRAKPWAKYCIEYARQQEIGRR